MAGRKPDRQDVTQVLARVASEHGLPLDVMMRFAGIESTFNPRAKTGSYKGLYMLSREEFKRHGSGDIFNAEDNARAFARILKRNANLYERQTGHTATGQILYLMHQQGTEGGVSHLANPNNLAWINMYNTSEGRRKGKAWAKKAIWGNVPASAKREFKKVENVTSQQFTNMWNARYEREGYRGAGSTAVAFDSRGARTPEMPDRGARAPTSRMASLDVGGGETASIDDTPQRRSVKYDYRAPEYARATSDPEVPPAVPGTAAFLAAVAPEVRRGRAALSSPIAPSDPDAERSFGSPFGELYARPDQGSSLLSSVLPERPPLLRDLFG